MRTGNLWKLNRVTRLAVALAILLSLAPALASAQAVVAGYDAFVLVIDCSGSMHEWKEPNKTGGFTLHPGTDPEDLRVTAARVFVELLPPEDKVGAVSFYTDEREVNGSPDINYSLSENDAGVHVDTIFGLQEIGTEDNRQDLVGRLERARNSEGFTFIRKALESASAMLNADRNARNRYIILLTDGSPSQSWRTPSPYGTSEWTEELRNGVIKTAQETVGNGISIYPVLLSDANSVGFMRDIAHRSSEATGKGMFFDVSKPEDLSDVFSKIFSDTKSFFFRDAPENNIVAISEFTKQTHFLLLRTAQSETFSIVTPGGVAIRPDQDTSGAVSYRWSEDQDKNYMLLVLNNPEPGDWGVKGTIVSEKLVFSIIEGLYLNLELDRPKSEELFYSNEDIPIEGRVVLSQAGLRLEDLEYQVVSSILDASGTSVLKSVQLPDSIWGTLSSAGAFQQTLPLSSYSELPVESEMKVSVQILLRLKKDKRLVYRSVPILARILPGNYIKIDGTGIREIFEWREKLPGDFPKEIAVENPDGRFDGLSLELRLDGEAQKYFTLETQTLTVAGAQVRAVLALVAPLRKSLFRSQVLRGGVSVAPVERGYNVEPSFLPIYVEVHSLFRDYWYVAAIALTLLVVGLLYWFAKWVTLPWPVGVLVSVPDGDSIVTSGTLTVKLRDRGFWGKLLHKSRFYIGSAKNNDRVIRGMAKRHFCISAQRVRNPRTKRSELAIALEPNRGSRVRPLTGRLALAHGDRFGVPVDNGKELVFEYRKR